MKKTTIFLLLTAILIVGFVSTGFAQKKRTRPAKTEALMAPPITDKPCRPVDEPALVAIAADGALTLGGKSVETANLTGELVNYICGKTPDRQIIYVRAAGETPFSRIAEVIRLGRKLEVDDVVLMLDAGEALKTGNMKIVTDEPAPSTKKVKPYPLALFAALQADGKIELNGKPETVPTLTAKLAGIFKSRQEKGIFLPGSRETEKTVFVYARPTVKFDALFKFIKEIEKTGPYPVVLDIDDGYLNLIF